MFEKNCIRENESESFLDRWLHVRALDSVGVGAG
jgi:hypothetical protein